MDKRREVSTALLLFIICSFCHNAINPITESTDTTCYHVHIIPIASENEKIILVILNKLTFCIFNTWIWKRGKLMNKEMSTFPHLINDQMTFYNLQSFKLTTKNNIIFGQCDVVIEVCKSFRGVCWNNYIWNKITIHYNKNIPIFSLLLSSILALTKLVEPGDPFCEL